MSFPNIDAERRNDTSFRSRTNEKHHKETSLLENLNIDMILSFPTSDSLHLLDLGIMRRCMIRWVFGEKSYRRKWSKNRIDYVSRLLENCQKTMPMEIHRAVRNLTCLRKWKGVEYRTILMYVGMVVFKQVLLPSEYSHFMILCCAVRICSSKMYKYWHSTAEKMFKLYVQKYVKIYGRHSIGSNVHLLSHIMEDIRRNELDNIMDISTYKFENCLRLLGLNLKHGNLPLEQVSRRLIEMSQLPKSYDINDLFEKQRYSPQVQRPKSDGSTGMRYDRIEIAPNVTLTNRKSADSWFLTCNEAIVKMMYAEKKNDKYAIAGVSIQEKKEFFKNPLTSTQLNIYASDGKLNDDLRIHSIDSIVAKMVCLPCEGEFVFIPLEHSMDSLNNCQY